MKGCEVLDGMQQEETRAHAGYYKAENVGLYKSRVTWRAFLNDLFYIFLLEQDFTF